MREPNELEKYMTFTTNNKLSFIDSFQFLSCSLDVLVKNLSKNDSKYVNNLIMYQIWLTKKDLFLMNI